MGVEANLLRSNAAPEGAAVAHGHEDGKVGDAGRDEHRDGDLAAIDRQLHDVGGLFAGLVAGAKAEPQFACRLGADHRSVVPGQLGDRVGELLQPGVVGKAAVIGLVVEGEDGLERGLGGGSRRGQLRNLRRQRRPVPGGGDGAGRGGELAAVERTAPGGLKVAGDGGLPLVAHQVVARAGLAGEAANELKIGDRLEQRGNERLLDAQRAVPREEVAPALECMRHRDVPGGRLGGLVSMVAEVDAQRGLGKRLAEVERTGRIVHRVDANEDERLDLALVEGVGQLLAVLGLNHARIGLDREGLGEAVEGHVHEVGKAMHPGGLALADDDDRLATLASEVLGNGVGPLGERLVGLNRGTAKCLGTGRHGDTRGGELGGEQTGEGAHLTGCYLQAVVGGCAGDREGGLDGIEAIDLASFGSFGLATARELAGQTDCVDAGAHEVCIEADHHVGDREVVDGVGAGNADERHALAGVRLIGVVVRVDLRSGVPLGDAGEQRAVGRGGLAVDDDRKTLTCALVTYHRCVHSSECLFERRLRAGLEGGAAAVGVIHIEHRRLREHIGAAAAGGVLFVALNLGGTTVLALDEQTERHAAYVEVGCEEAGLAVGLVLGAVRVGENVLHLLANTTRQAACEGGGGAHDGQELTT